jgi:hypothetical protein
LNQVIETTKINPMLAAQLILIAAKNKGIGNKKEALRQDLQMLYGDNCDIEDLTKQAINFSKNFQDAVKQERIYSGNQAATDLVGMRLKRLHPEYAFEIARSSKGGEKNLDDLDDIFNNKLGGIDGVILNNNPDSRSYSPTGSEIGERNKQEIFL